MAPKLVVCQYRSKVDNTHYNIIIKKLNRSLRTITQLRKRNNLLYFQNKELSHARNSLLLQKLELERENNKTKSLNIQLNASHHAVTNKLGTIEQTLQTCVPALVTLSQCIPSMLSNVHELSKIEKINDNITKDKTKRLTRSVRPMVQGLSIHQPTVNISRIDCMMSPIIESPSSESQTPRVQRTSSSRISPSNKSSLEPYVRLKDVAVMLRNTKSVSSENSTKQSDNLGEGPSWLHNAGGQIENVQDSENTIVITKNNENSFNVSDENVEGSSVPNIPHGISTSISNSIVAVDNTSYETEKHYSELTSTPDSSMLRNITSRKRRIRRSSESSVVSDIEDSRSSQRSSKRSAAKRVNYKEPNLHDKLRRN